MEDMMAKRGGASQPPVKISTELVRLLRANSQRLARPTKRSDVATLLRDICGVQAQYPASAALAVRARLPRVTECGVEQARVEERTIVRTWCMRGTLHLLAADDLFWLVALHGEHFIARSKRRYRELGLDEKRCAKNVDLVASMLASGVALTREEVKAGLARRGRSIAGQALYHILRRAALAGLVCFGADHDGEPTYVSVESWLGGSKPQYPEDPLAELARRYLRAFGPVTLTDMASWSGLPKAMLQRGWNSIANEVEELMVNGKVMRILDGQATILNRRSQDYVRLIGAYDPYLLGYADRDIQISARFAKQLHPGGGLLRPALLADGYVIATWRMKRQRKVIEIEVSPFEELKPLVCQQLIGEVEALEQFLGLGRRGQPSFCKLTVIK